MTLHEWLEHPPSTPQWAYDRNDLDLEQLNTYSRKKAWWRCDHGHEWQAEIRSVAMYATGCPYCTGKKANPGETDLATTHPHLLSMWSDKNTLNPTQVTAGSQRKVWWKCVQGHEWQAKIVSVTGMNTGCPYCAGKKAIPGETDLATLRPELLEQWDFEKNTRNPREVTVGSRDKIWWKCTLGHSWQSEVFCRTRKKSAGCPYCTGRKVLPGFNDLATLKPKLAGEWYQPLNGTLKPEDVTLGSNKHVWWQCADGHVWKAYIYHRTRKKGSGCPVCAGNIKYIPSPRKDKKKLQSCIIHEISTV